jgi:nicotinamidase-related amidase
MNELRNPPHFDKSKVDKVWKVDYLKLASQAEDWAAQQKIRPAAEDERRICLLLVDCQNTFCTPGYELFVAGRSGNAAVEDSSRICEFIYRNLGSLTQTVTSMDTHAAMQVFHPIFLINDKGEHPQPPVEISVEDVESGKWRANPAVADYIEGKDASELQEYLLHYCRELREREKYSLMIWPYHSMLGGIGHCLVSAIEEALFFHNQARQTQNRFEIKGNIPLTENYSVFGPEVTRDEQGNEIASENNTFVEAVLQNDAVIIGGQAKSHCVAWTISDLLDEIYKRDKSLAEKVYLLEDCTSPVVLPDGPDFTEAADAEFKRFSEAGVRLVRSTDSMSSWPGMTR